MTITTTQVTADEALRAVADGKSVQMIWMDDSRPFFSDFTAKIRDAMAIGEAFLIVEVEDDEMTVKAGTPLEEIAISQQNFADTCENAAEVHPEPSEPKPSALENFRPLEIKKRNRNVKKLDDGKIIALYNANWSVKKIADEMGVGDKAIYAHLKTLREEGRL